MTNYEEISYEEMNEINKMFELSFEELLTLAGVTIDEFFEDEAE